MKLNALYGFIAPVVHPRELTHGGKTHAFYVRELTADEAEKLFSGIKDGEGAGIRKKLIVACICDADGKPVFDEEQAGAIAHGIAMKFSDAALEVNALTDKSKEDAGNAH